MISKRFLAGLGIEESRADARNRTADLFLTMELLCQLSYIGLMTKTLLAMLIYLFNQFNKKTAIYIPMLHNV